MRLVGHCKLKSPLNKIPQTVNLKISERLECYRPIIEWLNEIVVDERLTNKTEISQHEAIQKHRVTILIIIYFLI